MPGKHAALLRLEVTKSDSPTPDFVVLVHGLGTRTLLNDVGALVKTDMSGADLAVVKYDAGLFSDQSAVDQTHELALEIGRKVAEAKEEKRPYRALTLIGHSIGALLIRGAYLMARGAEFGLDSRIPSESQPWARPAPSDPQDGGPYVDRLVLLGGLNKGWNAPDVDRLGRFRLIKWAAISSIITFTDLANRAAFMKSVISGSPSVHNLRMNW